MSDKPNCYNCIHRRSLPGDTHSSCAHPSSGAEGDSFGTLMAMLASVGRVPGPAGSMEGVVALNISASEHGIRNGWFNWPWNFDPIWLESCNGFEENKVAKSREE